LYVADSCDVSNLFPSSNFTCTNMKNVFALELGPVNFRIKKPVLDWSSSTWFPVSTQFTWRVTLNFC
jgi:hypothetical protein